VQEVGLFFSGDRKSSERRWRTSLLSMTHPELNRHITSQAGQGAHHIMGRILPLGENDRNWLTGKLLLLILLSLQN
jgi:hypothetical protein